MNRRNPLFLRGLLVLLLAAGPLQAQVLFACAMMGTVVHDECCCGEHTAGGDLAGSPEEPCCERAIAVAVDQEASPVTPAARPAEVDSGADPPALLSLLPDALVPAGSFSTHQELDFPAAAGPSGSGIWLSTRRLRI